MKIATQSSKFAGLVALANGMTITKAKAVASGYAIARDAEHANELRSAAEPAMKTGASTYLAKLLALPEGQERPVAAARIAAKHTEASMPLPKAALFLSGLQCELPEVETPKTECSPALDALLRRKCELHLIGLNRKAPFEHEAKEDARSIRYALDLHRGSRMTMMDALLALKVDIPRLQAGLKRIPDPTTA